MIGHLPLWLLVMLWWLQRHTAPRLNTANYPRILRFLDDLYAMVPVPRTRFEWWLVKKITNWVDREKSNLFIMRSLGVIATGAVPIEHKN